MNTGWINPFGVSVSILRADLVDAEISGNKYFKLLPNLQAARSGAYSTLLSFGGYWSNHLHALAAAGHRFGFNTVGIIRGEEPAFLNPCLTEARAWGMELEFVSRARYRRRNYADYQEYLAGRYSNCMVIPEGGANLHGIQGCQKLVRAGLEGDFSHLLLACGTGTTLCGLITATSLPVTGIQALKGKGYLQAAAEDLLARHRLTVRSEKWEVLDDFHRGGFAKADKQLLNFIDDFQAETGIPLEPVYSGKLFMALQSLLESGYYPAGSRVLVIHGGGLQGLRGWERGSDYSDSSES